MRLPSRAKTTSAAQINISGKWRITEMDLWDREAIDLVGPAFIEFKGEGGQFRFIAVDGWMDCRHGQRNGRPSVDFTWDGNDEGDPASGRGWVIWDVRRRILEASVRAPQGWHRDAIRAAYGRGDEVWRLTAVFCMRFVGGFEPQILEALASTNPDIHYEAVVAAGNWGLDAAWPHVAALVASRKTTKPLLLASIDLAASIRPHEALEILDDLADTDDEDIADAIHAAIALAEGQSLDDDELNGDDDSRST